MPKYTSKCQKCGETGLTWGSDPAGKWKLYPAMLVGGGEYIAITAVGEHVCSVTPRVASPAPVNATNSQPTVSPIQANPPAVSKLKPRKMLGINSPWYDVFAAAWEAGARRILIVGPPGTGKTTTARKTLDCADYEVTMHQGKEAMELEGYWTAESNPSGGVVTKWNYGSAVRAMREGKPLLINEISFTPEQILGLLYDLADEPAKMRLSTGELITAKEGYGCIMTDNDNVGVLKEAIIDRVECVIIAKMPHPAAIEELPEELRALSVNYFRALPSDPWDFSCSPTVRRVRAYHRLVQAGTMTADLCAMLVFGKAGKEIISALSTAARTDGIKTSHSEPEGGF